MAGTNDQSADRSDLCSTCKDLDFEEIFTSRIIPASGIGTEIATIGKRPTSFDKISCGLCLFFHQIRSNYTKNYVRHARLFNQIGYDTSQMTLKPPASKFLSVIRKNAWSRYDINMREEIIHPGLIGYISNDDRDDGDIRKIDSSAVGHQSICRQISHCSEEHAVCKSKRPSGVWLDLKTGLTIPGLLVDCVHGNIVKSKSEDQYLTLSYVWGDQSDAGKDTSHAFSLANAPLTIRDAVQVVRNLGRRFLWVDRYCIDQTDESSKLLTIGRMDDIYERSEVTIVAVHGQDDESGLPGVSVVPRSPQPCYEAERGSLVSSCPPIRTVIQDSKWNTRAWTYQEARLSRRCLFFSEHQVYLVCAQCTWSEAVPFPPSRTQLTSLLNSQGLSAGLFEAVSRQDSISNSHFADREEYSKRHLSYEEDILNGFQGILRRFPFVTIQGVPISLQNPRQICDIGLALGLLWFTKFPEHTYIEQVSRKRTIRRAGFPTWSWTSCVADIAQMIAPWHSTYGRYIRGDAVALPENEVWTQLWLSQRGLEPANIENIVGHSTNVIDEVSPHLLIEGEFVKLVCQRLVSGRRRYLLCGQSKVLIPDVSKDDQKWLETLPEDDFQWEEEVFILLQWHDAQRKNFRRLLLMVVEWIDDMHAERRGLLRGYNDEFRVEDLAKLPRTRKRFILQ